MAYLGEFSNPFDGDAPSVFEVLAQERIMPALRLAHHYVLAVGAQRHPRWLLGAHKHREEVFAFASALLEAHSLRTRGTSFGEQFYGMRRAVLAGGGPSRSARWHLAAALALLVVPAYARAKLEPLLGREADAPEAEDAEGDGMWSADQIRPAGAEASAAAARGGEVPLRLQVARFAYRAACAVGDAQHLAHLLLYMFGRSRYASGSQRLLGFSLRRANATDMARERLAAGADGPGGARSRLVGLLELPLRHARQLLLVSVLGYRLVEWWHASQHAPLPRLALVPPPPPPPPLARGVVTSATRDVCGVCLGEPVEPTASPSGYVFCAGCIYDAVARDGCCPLTKEPTDASRLYRLYETSRAGA